MANGIVVLGGFGDHDAEMALYVNGKLVTTAEIDGGKDGHSGKVYDFLGEFDVSPKSAGITDIDVMDEDPDVVTELRPNADMDDDMTDEKWEQLEESGAIDCNGDYEFTENLSDLAHVIPELSE